MNLTRNLIVATLMTLVTTVLLGLGYPLLVTGIAQIAFHDNSNGQLVEEHGRVVGSRIIGQPFTSPGYFWPRPSAAGGGYDATASSGSNLGPTNAKLLERVQRDLSRWQETNPGQPVPIELVTTSGSGLDPHLSPAGAAFQVPRVARARGMSEADVSTLVRDHMEGRQFGLLGEPRVNVLALNIALDRCRRGPWGRHVPTGTPSIMR
jgi:K+-transporting ATPase ATPase C chain